MTRLAVGGWCGMPAGPTWRAVAAASRASSASSATEPSETPVEARNERRVSGWNGVMALAPGSANVYAALNLDQDVRPLLGFRPPDQLDDRLQECHRIVSRPSLRNLVVGHGV